MKILLTSDWHLDVYRPENRLDKDYFTTQSKKIDWISDLAHKEGCTVILNGGDVFNSHKANDFTKRHYIRLLRFLGMNTSILSVYGQHDLRYHNSDRRNTPLGVLEAANVFTMLEAKPICIPHANFYGASWNEPIPEIVTQGFNVLVMHFLTFLDDNHPPIDVNQFQLATHLLIENKFDLILTGDNHQTFAVARNGRTLVNPGSLMRSRIDQYDHKPCVFIFDTDTRNLEQKFIPVQPINEVLDVEKAKKEKEEDEELKVYVKELSQGSHIEGLDFKINLWSFTKSSSLEEGVVIILEEVMDDGGDRNTH